MWFAAKEAVEKKAMERGRQAERERIGQAVEELKERGGSLTPEEIVRIIKGESDLRS